MIVLDTHVWVWWVSQAVTLPSTVERAINTSMEDKAVYVSSISAWEIALLMKRQRLELTMDVADWIARSESLPFVNFVPVDNQIALRSTRLPEPLHSDPADRMIISTALTLGARLVTKDQKLWDYPHIETLW